LADSEGIIFAIGFVGLIFGIIGMVLPGDYGIYGKLQIGNLVDRPITAINGQWYYSNDTDEMFYYNNGWFEVPLGDGGGIGDYDIYGKVKTGKYSDRPNFGISDRWYYCNDTQDMYYDGGSAWYKIEYINSSIFWMHEDNAFAHHGDWGHYGLMQYGLNNSKPSVGIIGRWYYANDTNQLWYENGISWCLINWIQTIHQVKNVIQTSDVSTSSSTFVDIPNMNITLTTGANKALIIFSCSVYMDVGSNWACSRLLIDEVVQDAGTSGLGIKGKMGAPGATKNQVINVYNPNEEFIGSGTFVGDIAIAILDFSTIKTLTAGQHTIKVQWRSDAGTGLYCRAATGYEHMNLIIIELIL